MPVIGTQLTSAANGTDATIYTTASITPSTNQLQLLAINIRRGGSVPSNGTTVSGCNLTWVQVATVSFNSGSSSDRTMIFRALGSSPTTGALTITAPEAQIRCSWSLTEFNNIDTTGTNGSGAIVQSATTQAAGGSNNGATVTLGAFGSTDNATYGACGINNPDGILVAGSGFTELANVRTETNQGFEAEWKNTNDTSVDWTWASSLTDYTAIAVEIKFVTPRAGAALFAGI